MYTLSHWQAQVRSGQPVRALREERPRGGMYLSTSSGEEQACKCQRAHPSAGKLGGRLDESAAKADTINS